jgi:hypothetical protein
MSKLSESIKELYQGNISDGEATIAESILIEYFKLLYKIDSRVKAQAKFQNDKTEVMKLDYENNGSSN